MIKYKIKVHHPETFLLSEIETNFPKILVDELEKKVNDLPFITTPVVMHPDEPNVIKFGIADENDGSEGKVIQKYVLELKIKN